MFGVHSNVTGPKRTPHTFLFGTGKRREPKETNLTVFRECGVDTRSDPKGTLRPCWSKQSGLSDIFPHSFPKKKTAVHFGQNYSTTRLATHTHAYVQQDPNGTREQQFWRVGGRYHSGLSPRQNERRGTDTMALQSSVHRSHPLGNEDRRPVPRAARERPPQERTNGSGRHSASRSHGLCKWEEGRAREPPRTGKRTIPIFVQSPVFWLPPNAPHNYARQPAQT